MMMDWFWAGKKGVTGLVLCAALVLVMGCQQQAPSPPPAGGDTPLGEEHDAVEDVQEQQSTGGGGGSAVAPQAVPMFAMYTQQCKLTCEEEPDAAAKKECVAGCECAINEMHKHITKADMEKLQNVNPEDAMSQEYMVTMMKLQDAFETCMASEMQ